MCTVQQQTIPFQNHCMKWLISIVGFNVIMCVLFFYDFFLAFVICFLLFSFLFRYENMFEMETKNKTRHNNSEEKEVMVNKINKL